MIYFGYCTLLDVNGMHKYCPTAELMGIGRVQGYKMSFATYSAEGKGGCSLMEESGHEVLGVLFEVTPEEMADLDKASGVDKGWYKQINVVATDEQGRSVAAVTYVIPEPLGPYHPSPKYVQPILTGARAFRFPKPYIAELEQIIEAAQRTQGASS